MDEAEIQEQQPYRIRQTSKNTELISIRKKLAAPNNILPGCMIRSQQPIHLLPFNPDFQSQPGYKMLLDEYKTQHSFDSSEKMRNFRSKTMLSKGNKTKFAHEFAFPKPKQSSKMTDLTTSLYQDMNENDPLAFLDKSLKNILQFPQQIVFISKTAFLNNWKNFNSKAKNLDQADQTNRKKQILIKYLKQAKYFASTSFMFDQPHISQLSKIPQYPQKDQVISFQDNFESSNIFLALCFDQQTMLKNKVENQKHTKLYLIAVRFDYNTKSYGQWFYFKVRRKEQPFSFSRQTNNLFKFMIVNMTKSSSMFGKGLKISVCRNGVWRKEGINIKYYKNSLKREDLTQNTNSIESIVAGKKPETYYTLQFTLEIYDGQDIYVSYNQPYTYSRVGKALDKITQVYQNNKRNIIDLKRNVICQTYLNNNIESLTFSAKGNRPESQDQKKVIFIVSRCHPIETAGSHVLQGLLNHLLALFIESPLQQQKEHIVYKLLQKYILKIVPMVNPDGVILGNSRCNIAGYDLNRSWRVANVDRCKQIYAIKKYVMQYQNRIQMFIDLHAHSKKKNVFAYGCHDMSNPFSTRQFPFLLSKLSENDFLFSQCRFTRLTAGQKSQKGGKDGTARVFLYDVLRIPNVFTIQNSYCSAKNSLYHYDKSSYQIIGADILKAISLYFSPNFKENDEWKIDKQILKVQSNNKSESDKNNQSISIEGKKHSYINSLTSSITEGLQLKLSVHSQLAVEKVKDKKNAVDLRERYLYQLRRNEQNIAIGLTKDGQASESQQEDRIYEIAKTKKLKSQREFSLKKKQLNKSTTAQRIVNYIKKNKAIQENDKQKEKKQKKNKSPSLQKISSTHSDTNLARVTNLSKNRFYTLSKNQQSIILPASFQEQEYIERKAINLRNIKQRKKRTMITQFDPFNNTKKVISVIQIGLGEYPQMVHDFRANLIQKVQGKFQVKLPHNQKQTTLYRDVNKSHLSFVNRNKEDQIKEYLRKLIRPKQILERKQRLVERQPKTQRAQLNLKQSNIHFSEMKLSKLVNQRSRFTQRGGN